MSTELNDSFSLGRSATDRRSSSISSAKQRFIDIRPKQAGSVVLVAPASPTEFKRKQHAQAQKQQRDRMKAALDRMVQVMEGGGVNAGTGGTKADLIEAAVGYIRTLQGEVEELRTRHATV
ncbi:hypothetical protein BJX99DRAFT_253935 [Aspergillus californicus]